VSRLRSVAVVVLLWVAAVAASSAPDGFGGPRHPEMPLFAGTVSPPTHADATPDGPRRGKRWAFLSDPDGKRWELADDRVGRRWG
jgi:hypothetical protein